MFIDGEHFTPLRGTYDELAEGFRALVDNYVATIRKTHRPQAQGIRLPGWARP